MRSRAPAPIGYFDSLFDSLQMAKMTMACMTLFAFAALLPFCTPQNTETRPHNSFSAAQRSTRPTGARLCTESGMLQPMSSPTIIYLITSQEPVSAKEFLADDGVALLAFSDPIPQDADCPCCVWSLLGETQDRFFSGWKESAEQYFPWQLSGDSRRNILRYMRLRLWFFVEQAYRAAHTDSSPQYFVFLDVNASNLPSRSNLTDFADKLLDELPHVAVPFHPCNSRDDSGNKYEITSVYDTSFTAIHVSARKLLLPLDDSLFSLVCHLMLRGSVMQFPFGNMHHSNAPQCEESDNENQSAMMHFVSSLTSKDLILPLPFSPRIQKPAAPLRYGLVHSTIHGSNDFERGGFYLGFFSDDMNKCPVKCSFHYWLSHPTFECCLSLTRGLTMPWRAAEYDVNTEYSETAARWNLPRAFDVASSFCTSMSCLTHPLPTFSLALSKPPVTLDDNFSCSSDQAGASDAFEIFSLARVSFQPDRLFLKHLPSGPPLLTALLQLTFSAPSATGAHIPGALFGSVKQVTINSNCDGYESMQTVADGSWVISSSTDSKFQSALPPWFYTLNGDGQQWFELSSNTSSDSLRALVMNVSVPTLCTDHMFLQAKVVLSIRFLAPLGGLCRRHELFAESQNVSFSSLEESKRSSVITENPPTDLFDDRDQAHAPRASNFACSGPNRHWPWEEQLSTALPSEMFLGSYNMCLLQNVCWINQELTLFLPPELEPLTDYGFFNFRTTLCMNLCPMSRMDFTRSFWYVLKCNHFHSL